MIVAVGSNGAIVAALEHCRQTVRSDPMLASIGFPHSLQVRGVDGLRFMKANGAEVVLRKVEV